MVNKSTVPVGSGDYVSMLIQDGIDEGGEAGADFRVVSNPEFLREGSAIYDSLFPDRIVVGADSREGLDTLRVLYEPIIEQSFPTELDPRPKVAVPFVTTDLTSAEMIKYASKAFLATKISFINEIANLCELVGADVTEVAYGIGLDERIGARILRAGIGWGGSCFLKDIAALRSIAREYDYPPNYASITPPGARSTLRAAEAPRARRSDAPAPEARGRSWQPPPRAGRSGPHPSTPAWASPPTRSR